MKSYLIFLLSITSLLIILLFKKSSTKYTTIKINNVSIKAEIANTVLTKTKGLMFRKSLPESEGMIFIFDNEDYHSFWMMNMSFPLDIIWINSEKKVVYMVKDAKPCGLICKDFYVPEEKAKYVLEVNANFTTKNKIKTGTKVNFTL
jgi:uncharacterized membrane protein (UPF0127 family)